MQFKVLFFAGLLGFASAAPIESEVGAIKEIVDAINSVAAAVSVFDNKLKTINTAAPTAADATILATESQAIVDAINKGTTAVKASTAISDADAPQLATAAATLSTNTMDYITRLTGMKAVIISTGQKQLVLDGLKKEELATDAFLEALKTKLSPGLATIADGIEKNSDAQFEKAISTFNS